MSTILKHLAGRSAIVLWTDVRLIRRKNRSALYYALLRFHVGKYSTVVLGTGKTSSMASENATASFLKVCEETGVLPEFEDPTTTRMTHSEEELAALRSLDEQWFMSVQ